MQGLRLIAPWIKGIAVKDFRWGQNAEGKWQPKWCPLGEGMVRFRDFFALLKNAAFSGPIQMHFEYPLGGAERGDRVPTIGKAEIMEAMRRDLVKLRRWLSDAQLA
jgi:sugar phosphate isomerase/epimerase